MRPIKFLAAALLAFVCFAAPVRAAPVTLTYLFSASNFLPPGAPVSPVTGSFTVTFDPTTTALAQTSGITQNSLNLTIGSTRGFNHLIAGDTLQIGATQNLITGVLPFTNDFFIVFTNASTNPTFVNLTYSQGGFVYTSLTGNVRIPEPTTLALFGAGLAGLALARRRKAGTA